MQATCKHVQRRLFNAVSTKSGALLTVICLFATLNSVLWYNAPDIVGSAAARRRAAWLSRGVAISERGAAADERLRGFGSTTAPCHLSTDNLGGVPFLNRYCVGPIDLVYTWVNGSDVAWVKSKLEWQRRAGLLPPEDSTAAAQHKKDAAATANRYRDNGELKYSLRSIVKYAPWVRNVYLVTANQIPEWLDLSFPRVRVVPHSEIYPNASHLPVFSSPSIETHIHRISGLSDNFIYFNDDVMLASPVWPEDFMSMTGQKMYFAWEAPLCADGCSFDLLSNGNCDDACNNERCGFDIGDCDVAVPSEDGGDGTPAPTAAPTAAATEAKPQCATGCQPHWLGDKMCDNSCNNPECAFDGTDCAFDRYGELAGYAVTPSTSVLVFSALTPSLYLNFSALLPGSASGEGTPGGHRLVVESAEFDDSSDVIIAQTYSQLHRVLTMALVPRTNDGAGGGESSSGSTTPSATPPPRALSEEVAGGRAANGTAPGAEEERGGGGVATAAAEEMTLIRLKLVVRAPTIAADAATDDADAAAAAELDKWARALAHIRSSTSSSSVRGGESAVEEVFVYGDAPSIDAANVSTVGGVVNNNTKALVTENATGPLVSTTARITIELTIALSVEVKDLDVVVRDHRGFHLGDAEGSDFEAWLNDDQAGKGSGDDAGGRAAYPFTYGGGGMLVEEEEGGGLCYGGGVWRRRSGYGNSSSRWWVGCYAWCSGDRSRGAGGAFCGNCRGATTRYVR